MIKMKQLSVFLIISLLFLIAACGSASGVAVEPTARPYTSDASQGEGASASGPVVGHAEDGLIVFEENCSECHSIVKGEHIEGPSLFEAGARYEYDYVKESVLSPSAHLAYLEGEFEVDDSIMPTDFGEYLSAQQLEDVVAYVLSLK